MPSTSGPGSEGRHWLAFMVCAIALVCSCASADDVASDEVSDSGSDAAGGEAGEAGSTSQGGSGASDTSSGGATSTGGTAGSGGTNNGGTGGTNNVGTGGTNNVGTGGTSQGGSGAAAGAAGTCEQLDFGQNDTEQSAFELQPISDCDDEGGTLEGTLAPGDVDWFTFVTEDKTLCSVNPSVDVTSAENVRLCLYFECENGSGADVGCPSGSEQDTSGEGRPGCCSSASPIEPDLNCKGTLNEAARVWIEVSWPGNSNCKDYAVDYHY